MTRFNPESLPRDFMPILRTGRALPTALRSAPALQAGLRDDATLTEGKTAFSANQRDEVPDWHDVTVALRAQPGMMQQTCIAES